MRECTRIVATSLLLECVLKGFHVRPRPSRSFLHGPAYTNKCPRCPAATAAAKETVSLCLSAWCTLSMEIQSCCVNERWKIACTGPGQPLPPAPWPAPVDLQFLRVQTSFLQYSLCSGRCCFGYFPFDKFRVKWLPTPAAVSARPSSTSCMESL
ncbi:hypothetical protein BDW62DRAFT_13055 [Aspergillus aurantiobrunneus]